MGCWEVSVGLGRKKQRAGADPASTRVEHWASPVRAGMCAKIEGPKITALGCVRGGVPSCNVNCAWRAGIRVAHCSPRKPQKNRFEMAIAPSRGPVFFSFPEPALKEEKGAAAALQEAGGHVAAYEPLIPGEPS